MNIQHLPYEIDETANRFLFYETLWKRRALELLLKHCAPAGKTLLDYGSGRGEMLQFAAAAGFQVQGTDLDPKCVELSQRHGPTRLLDAANPLQQFGAKSFDVVSCFHVLEHVDNPKAVLGALAQMARAYVLIAVPNLRYLHRTFRRSFRRSEVNAGHLQAWDHWHFLNLAETHCGLEWIEWGTDATQLPLLSNLAHKIAGDRFTIWLETGIFRKAFPYHGISVLGLFRPKRQ
ncbi:MAG TPA: class I SAM-dependent methyltransferase [Verrucomicrobiota bacterium]|nr:class I SAM-dependent methyltransferase [Verrucomicrobiota bacterium]HNT13565.1 class I SAM-dependent methyltransferase [Verrucomicrobiota bacterium]